MHGIPGTNTRVWVDEESFPLGWCSTCPICKKINKAAFDTHGTLIWYPNKVAGEWCIHALGAYAGAGLTPQFIFS